MPEPIDLHPENLGHANWRQLDQKSMPVLSVRQIRTLEQTAFSHIDSFLLMQAAGVRSALKIVDQIVHSETHSTRCLVLAGPGNNGGDACIVAGELKRKGMQVDLFQITEGKQGSKDRMQAVLWALAHGVQPIELESEISLPEIAMDTVIVDGLLGIACDRPPQGLIERLIQHINAHRYKARVYALDCPSGLNCDTGSAPGAAVQAHTTFSYLACKHGLLSEQGKDLCGELWIDTLNCDALLDTEPHAAEWGMVAHAVSRLDQLQHLPKRGHQHHKGSFGSIAVLGGQQGMVGACVLSARTALMLGCGRVALTLLHEADMHLPDVQRQGQSPFLDLNFPEIMNKGLESNLEFADTAVIGPGLGQSEEALSMVHALLEHDKGLNMVWDADALNLLAANSTLRARLERYRRKHHAKSLVFTPHPLEAARLLQSTTDMIQADRMKAVKSLASQFDCTVVLKGTGSLICNSNQIEINTTGGPALATAGSGDVLAGAVAAMLGQGLGEFRAASFAVYLHGLAVEPIGREQEGLSISHASEIAQRMKTGLNHLLSQSARRNG
jgi:ADP-dependent NAD(P)H-hydrate dehydratase / NAD(P)H-hydrate epimerase